MASVTGATATNTEMDDDNVNPASNVANDFIVHCTLKFRGVEFIPNDLYDALDAEWGTVSSDKGTQARNCFEFVIEA